MHDDDGHFGAIEVGAAIAAAGAAFDLVPLNTTGGGATQLTVNVNVTTGEEPIPFVPGARTGHDNFVEDWDSYIGQEPLKAQLEVHMTAATREGKVLDHCLLASGMPGVGKGHDLDTRVLTPGGWVRIGDLIPGMQVMGADGYPTEVLDIYDRGVLDLYDVVFSDGSHVRCDGDHLWQVQSPKQRHNSQWQTRSVTELMSESLTNRAGQSRWYVPMVYPVRHPSVDLPVPPYLAGVMLSNADFTKGVIALNKADRDIAERCEIPLVEYPAHTSLRFRPERAQDLLRALGQLGVSSGNKFVPEVYLTAALEDRQALLAGLLDCDGGVRSGRGLAQFHTTSKQLALDVQDLVESLGGTARLRDIARGDEIRVEINIWENPFRSTRKAARWNRPTRGPSRSIKAIRHVGEAPVRCIRVAAADHLYVTERYLVTHNTTLARLIAAEMGAPNVVMLVPPFSKETLFEALLSLKRYDVLFIDEIHKLADQGPRASENLLTALEEGKLYMADGVHELAPFTLIGATTDADKLPETIIDRFPIKPYFQAYSMPELVRITKNFADFYGVQLLPETMVAIAKACRGTPRISRELVISARDLQLYHDRFATAREVLDFKEVTDDGLTRQHKAYLGNMYKYFGRPGLNGMEYVAGEASLMSLLRENKKGIARLERYLIETGLLDKTSRGRILTPAGIERAKTFAV